MPPTNPHHNCLLRWRTCPCMFHAICSCWCLDFGSCLQPGVIHPAKTSVLGSDQELSDFWRDPRWSLARHRISSCPTNRLATSTETKLYQLANSSLSVPLGLQGMFIESSYLNQSQLQGLSLQPRMSDWEGEVSESDWSPFVLFWLDGIRTKNSPSIHV